MARTPVAHASDALVIGAGPAGASAAILLAQAGWRVSMIEQSTYPRQKVCGGCIAAGSFALLDELGVGDAVRRLAGSELTHVGWMRADISLIADMPACTEIPDRYGRALGRDVLDELLLQRAVAAGVRVFQPAKVRKVSGRPGDFRCEIEDTGLRGTLKSPARLMALSASLIIDAHGSWESGPQFEIVGETGDLRRTPHRPSDLFAFMATFARSALTPGLLPVVALDGGYGGIVVANAGRTTVALCLRRDALRALRIRNHGVPAALAVEKHLRESCRGIRDALRDAQREGSWLTVGPLRPGIRLHETAGVFRVGNASGESHPLIGEGISMALQSSRVLVDCLIRHAPRVTDAKALRTAHDAYEKAWRKSFLPRLRFASLYAHVAMHASLAASLGRWLRRWPRGLTIAARLAGKARRAIFPPGLSEELL
jgi:flavin-dependent dehydrogenase